MTLWDYIVYGQDQAKACMLNVIYNQYMFIFNFMFIKGAQYNIKQFDLHLSVDF